MRRMVYVLSNGIVVRTQNEALDSELEYQVSFEEIKEDTTKGMTAKQLANRIKL